MSSPPILRTDQRPATPQGQSRLGISFIQVVATALAAITATVVASFFGIAGTVIGAGISSMLSVVGTALYGHSLRKTRERMRVVVPVAARRNSRPVPAALAAVQPPRPTYAPPPPYREAADAYGPVQYSSRRRLRGARLAFAAAALFVVVLAVVTGVEAIGQRPLSDLVRGNDTVSGTTLFGARQHASGPTHRHSSAATAPTSTVTRTVTRTHSRGGSPSEPAPTRSARSSSSVTTPSPSPTSGVPSDATASPPTDSRPAALSPLG